MTACSAPEASDTSSTDGSTSPSSTSTTVPPTISNGSYIRINTVDNASGALQAIEFDVGTLTSVDISGLTVDLACARGYSYRGGLQALRSELLETGCAEISGEESAIPEEQAMQAEAMAAGRGIWRAPASPTAASGGPPVSGGSQGVFESVGAFIAQNWIALTSLAAALLAIPIVDRAIRRRRERRYHLDVYVFLAGTRSAGKTDLWDAWIKRRAIVPAPNSQARPTIETNIRIAQTDSMDGYTLHPRLVDIGGLRSYDVVRQMRAAPATAKRVLVIVAAPRGLEVQGESPVVDQRHMDLQRGYLTFPISLLGNGDERLQPDLVVLFVSKFDLLAPNSPDDSASDSQRAHVRSLFEEEENQLRVRCEETRVPFKFIIGSSRRYWGVTELRDEVALILTEDR